MDIYVGNLPYSTTDEDLKGLFAAHGEVASARVVIDRMTGRSKGFGFVEMADRAQAQQAIDALGYVPNIAARRMGGAKSFLIVAINDRHRTIENWRAGHGNDWVDQMLYGGMTAAEKHGYHMLFELVDTNPDADTPALRRELAALDGTIKARLLY